VRLGWRFSNLRVGIDGLHGFVGEIPKLVLIGKRADRAEGVQLKEEFVVQTDMDVATGNSQVFKAAASQDNPRLATRFVVIEIVNGRNSPHDAVRRDDVQNVEAFDRGCHLSGMRESRLSLGVFQFHFASNNVGIPGLEGHQIVEPEMIDAGVADASDTRQDGGRLYFDDALEWPRELSA